MPKFTARRLLHTLNEGPRQVAPPLNLDKWRIQIRDIRNQLIKLRDKADDDLVRLDRAIYDTEDMGSAEEARVSRLSVKMSNAVDAIAEAINQLDLTL